MREMKLLIDLDGTLLDGASTLPDAAEFMSEISARNVQFKIVTNSTKDPAAIAKRLDNAGISVSSDSIINPIVSINAFLRRQQILSAFIIGSKSEKDQVCIHHVDDCPEIIVFLDFDRTNVDFEQLQNIFLLSQKGIPIISASGSPFYRTGNERKIDTGAFVTMFELLTQENVPIFGKPNSKYFNEAITLLESSSSDVVVLGDDWATDIVGANNVGCKSVLVKSGKYQPGDENKAKPDRVIDRLMVFFEN